MIRTYAELSKMDSYKDRFLYLQLNGVVGEETFGFDRYLNQVFYSSYEWKKVRRLVILRDDGNDMGMDDYPIQGRIMIHHMNPITVEDIEQRKDYIMDPEYLICVSHQTHEAIHYGDYGLALYSKPYVERQPNDMIPWR